MIKIVTSAVFVCLLAACAKPSDQQGATPASTHVARQACDAPTGSHIADTDCDTPNAFLKRGAFADRSGGGALMYEGNNTQK